MSQAEELLDNLSEKDISAYTATPETEEHITIDEFRNVNVPFELRRLAVQFDHNVETVTFDCPRYWDGLDMSLMRVYINYLRPDNARGMYLADNVRVDETDGTVMHFDWTVSRNVTLIKGTLRFLVCIKKADEEGNEVNHWNSELNDQFTISEGLECEESILADYPDIITQLLNRMEYTESIANPDTMQEYISTFLTSTDEVRKMVHEFLKTHDITSPEEMQIYVNTYMASHSPFIVVGTTRPDYACLWFDTSEKAIVATVDQDTQLNFVTEDSEIINIGSVEFNL